MRKRKRYFGEICKAHLIYAAKFNPEEIEVKVEPGAAFLTAVPKKDGKIIITLPSTYTSESKLIWGRIHEEYHAAYATPRAKLWGHPKKWAGYPEFYIHIAVECIVDYSTANFFVRNDLLNIVEEVVSEYQRLIQEFLSRPEEVSYEKLASILPAYFVLRRLNLIFPDDISPAWTNALKKLGFMADKELIEQAFNLLEGDLIDILRKNATNKTRDTIIGYLKTLIPPIGYEGQGENKGESKKSRYDDPTNPNNDSDIDIEALLDELRKGTKFIDLPKKISVIKEVLTIENFGRRFRMTKLAKALVSGDTTALFKKIKSGVKGIIMMDLSGSMSPDVEVISEIIRAFPGTEVYGYFSKDDTEKVSGKILKISDGYKVAHPSDLHKAITGSGNGIDLLAVKFMLDRKRSKKLEFAIFISDGGFCGGPGYQAHAAMTLLLSAVNHKDVLWFRSWESVKENLSLLVKHINSVCR